METTTLVTIIISGLLVILPGTPYILLLETFSTTKRSIQGTR